MLRKIFTLFIVFIFITPAYTFAQDGEMMPSFELVSIDGEVVSSESLVGVPLVVNVWATWCPFCKNELPYFAQLQREYGDSVRVIAIDRGESEEEVRAYLEGRGLEDDIIFLQDPDDEFYRAIGGISMPETLFIDTDGSIAIHKRGPMALSEMQTKLSTLVPSKEGISVDGTGDDVVTISWVFMVAAFLAGLITFLAPCTLPLVPAYLGFISGVSRDDFTDATKASGARRKVLRNALAFVLGFSIIFVLFGLLVGLLGAALVPFQIWLTRVGGVFIIFFGLFLLGVFNISFLQIEKRMKMPSFLTVGKPSSSFVIGSAFAFGWTPCVGPVLGSILALAAVSSTAWKGAFLLAIFSLGLAVPFIATAVLFLSATKYIRAITKYLAWVQKIGGVILLLVGWLLLTNDFSFLIEQGFRLLEGFGYEDSLLRFL